MEDLAEIALATLCLQMPNSERKIKRRGKGKKEKKWKVLLFLYDSISKNLCTVPAFTLNVEERRCISDFLWPLLEGHLHCE